LGSIVILSLTVSAFDDDNVKSGFARPVPPGGRSTLGGNGNEGKILRITDLLLAALAA
jgi:hypothetical protein